MKIKLLVGTLVLLIVVNIAAIGAFLAVQMHHPRAHREFRGRLKHDRPFARFNREKRQDVLESMQQFHEEIGGLVKETAALEDDVASVMGESPVRRERIDSLLVRISANRLEIARRATDRMIEMGETLAPDEREHLMRALMRMRGHRERRDGHWKDEVPREN
jgi:hypothetical protein